MIDRAHAAIALAIFGRKALPPDLVKDLRGAGEVPEGPALIDDAFTYGQLLAVMRDPALATKSPAEVAKLVEERKLDLARSAAEKAAVDTAAKHAGQYCVGLGTRVAGQTMAAVTGAEAGLSPSDMVDIIRDKTAADIAKRETVDRLKSDLGHAAGNWTRDWQRIAMTETNNAMQEGVASTLERRHGSDVLVSRVPRPDACSDCKRLFLAEDGNPRVFVLSELRANGSNVGRKKADWKPTIEAVHPWCGCETVYIPTGTVWVNGELVPETTTKSEAIEKATRKLHYRTTFAGMPISIENRKGSIRRWYDPHNDEHGETRMKAPYGYIRLTEGADGDHVDCYLGPDEDAPDVYVVHQRKKLSDGSFGGYDEDKAILGVRSKKEAKRLYLAHYNDPRFYMGMTRFTLDAFKRALDARKGKKLSKGHREPARLYLAKAGGPFIGPRGGLWADPQHTIPWHGDAGSPHVVNAEHVIEEEKRSDSSGKQAGHSMEAAHALIREHGDHVLARVPIEHLSTHFDDGYEPSASEKTRLAEYAQLKTEPPPIRATFTGRRGSKKLYVQNGNHRAMVARARGDTHINAFVPKGHYEKFLAAHQPTAALAKAEGYAGPYIGPKGGKWADPEHTITWHEGVPNEQIHDDAHQAVRQHAIPAAHRAAASGAHAESLSYVGAGAEGLVFSDKHNRAYKVARYRLKGDRLRDEAEALQALADSPAAKYAPKIHSYNREHDVLARDKVEGRPGNDWQDGSKLQKIHEEVSKELRERGFTAPEYKADSYIIQENGTPKLVDVGFTFPIGKRLAARLDEKTSDIDPKKTDLFDLQMDLKHALTERAISYAQAKKHLDRMKAAFGDSDDMKRLATDLEWTAKQNGEIKPEPKAAAEPAVGSEHEIDKDALKKIGFNDDFAEQLSKVRVVKEEGDRVRVALAGGGEGQWMPKGSFKHFVNDLSGRVDVPEGSGDPHVDAVAKGKAEFLGKGDDGLAFKHDGHVVKVSTTVPFQPFNDAHRTPEAAADQLEAQAKNAQRMTDEGVPGVLTGKVVRHGDKAFHIKPYVEIPEKLSREQLDSVAESMKAMHEKGWTLGDQIQVGVHAGKLHHYDTGKAKKHDDTSTQSFKWARDDDVQRLKALYRQHGEEYVDDKEDPLEAWHQLAAQSPKNMSDAERRAHAGKVFTQAWKVAAHLKKNPDHFFNERHDDGRALWEHEKDDAFQAFGLKPAKPVQKSLDVAHVVWAPYAGPKQPRKRPA